jgi:hypothetical protein
LIKDFSLEGEGSEAIGSIFGGGGGGGGGDSGGKMGYSCFSVGQEIMVT